MKYFLYLSASTLVVTTQVRGLGELLASFNTPQAAGAYGLKHYPSFPLVWETKKFHGVTEATRAKMAAAKMGSRNPSFGGRSDEVKKKISDRMKGTRRGSANPFYGFKQPRKARVAISLARSARRFIWVLDPNGKEHQAPLDFVLPHGWVRGRARR
jgi:hypothetical protein